MILAQQRKSPVVLFRKFLQFLDLRWNSVLPIRGFVTNLSAVKSSSVYTVALETNTQTITYQSCYSSPKY